MTRNLWHSTPAQYLEKIFQVVLTLPPLDTGGYQRLLRTLVGTRPDQPTPAPLPPAASPTSPRRDHPGSPHAAAMSDRQPQPGPQQRPGYGDEETACSASRYPPPGWSNG